MTLHLESHLKEDAAVLTCKGRLIGGDETAELRNAVTACLKERERVILDLAGIEYMNSGGLSTLVGLYSTARTSGGTITYVNLSVPIDFKKQSSAIRAA